MADASKKATDAKKPIKGAMGPHGHHPVALVIMISRKLTPGAKRKLTGRR